MSREDDDLSRRVVHRLRKMEAERDPCSELPKIYETGGVNPTPPMTNTPSPTDEDRELIERLRRVVAWDKSILVGMRLVDCAQAADRLESLLSDRAKLEERVRELEDAIDTLSGWGRLPKPINRSTDRAT